MNKKYQVIYADPPWKYNFSPSKISSVDRYYDTISLEKLKCLQVPSEDNSVLFLWVIAPKLLEGLDLLKSWGFQYKTNAVWDKDRVGMGYWFLGQHELLLVGTKGKFSPPKAKWRVSSIYVENTRKHAKKPDYFRDLILRSYRNESKIELFSRQKTDGWDCWGNEVEPDIELGFKNENDK